MTEYLKPWSIPIGKEPYPSLMISPYLVVRDLSARSHDERRVSARLEQWVKLRVGGMTENVIDVVKRAEVQGLDGVKCSWR